MNETTQNQITVGTRTFTLLFPDLLRPLSVDEQERLRASIRELGIQVAIKVDEQDGVIDGGHRLTIASELGLPLEAIPLDVKTDLTLDQKRALALTLNEDRRQLSVEDRQEMALRLRQQGMSFRVIGGHLGVDEKTVRNDVNTATADNSAVALPATIVGRDRKERPATRPTAKRGHKDQNLSSPTAPSVPSDPIVEPERQGSTTAQSELDLPDQPDQAPASPKKKSGWPKLKDLAQDLDYWSSEAKRFSGFRVPIRHLTRVVDLFRRIRLRLNEHESQILGIPQAEGLADQERVTDGKPGPGDGQDGSGHGEPKNG